MSSHSHSHSHAHSHGEHSEDPTGRATAENQHLTQAERSRLHFDKFAQAHEDKWAEGRRYIAQNLQKHISWMGVDFTKPVRVLDYACGTGTVSHALASNVAPSSQFIGLDVSETKGADQYNSTSATLGFPPTFMRAYKGTLLEPTDPHPAEFAAPEFHNFDVVVCSMSLHHFDDPAYALQQLTNRARPDGGVVVIIDNVKEQQHGDHEIYKKATGHGNHVAMGYSQEKMREYYEGAGAGAEFEYVDLGEGPRVKMESHVWNMHVFIAKGRRVE